MKTSEQLREARSHIDTPEKWCQNAIGYTAAGAEIEYASELDDGVVGARHCAFGAIRAATRSGLPGCRSANDALSRVVAGTGFNVEAINWNNAPERTHAEVLAAFDRAIAIAEAEEAEQTYGDPLPALEPAEMDLATVRTAIAAHDAREAGDSRLLTAIREATDTRVDEDREMAA